MNMDQTSIPSACLAALTALLLTATHGLAVPPDLTAGGVPNNTRTTNLGPTGMRGWVYHVNSGGISANTGESRQIQVTAVDNGSPAHGVLAANDVILGANGTGADPAPFSSDARKSLALAIADAEARSPAMLKLLRWRSGTTTTVEITLRTMGAYSATAPYNCPKSSLILTEGAQWVFNNETSGRYSFGALSLLATGNAAYATKVRNEARAKVPGASTRAQMMSDTRDATSMITWERGHTLVFLAEYYLASGDSPATRDAQVLPGIEAYAVNIAKNSSLFGTVGHIFAEKFSDGSPNGPMGGVYGPVNSSGMPCFLGLLLARECGITHPSIQPAIDRASLFFASYTGRGAIPYGEHEPAYSHEGNGRSGLAALIFALEDTRVDAGKFFAKMATAAPSERENGHTGSFFNYLWAPLGAAAGGEAAAAEHFKRISWHLDLCRRWNGAFVYDCLNGEGPNSGATYNDFRMSTAALLVYALPLRQLHITGRGHDPERFLSAADVADAAAADDYSVAAGTTTQLIADTGNWSPKIRRLAAIELKARGVSTAQREQLQAIAANSTLPAHARAGACDALGRIANSASATVLASLLKDPENYVRYASAEALRYLSTSARQSVLTQVLEATVETAKPWQPIDAEDPLQFAHGRLAVLLFYGGSAYGPKGIIWNNLSGVDRNLLYPAIRAVAASPLGFTRNNLQWTYPLLSEADMRGVAGAVVDSVREVAPSDKMFASTVRQKGFDLLEKFNVAEGVPSGLKYMVEANAGDRTAALQTLKRYAASYTTVTPEPDVIAAVTPFLNATGGNAEQNASVKLAAQDVLNAIAADTNPRTLVPFKAITSVVADQPQLTLPANSTVLRVSSYDHAQGDTIFTWRKLSGPGEVTFTPNASADAATSNVRFDNAAGIYQFEVRMSDSRRLTEAYGTVSIILANASGTLPPMPNPATFATAPVSISDSAIHMTATTGSSPNGPVQYLFTEVSGNPGGTSSGWQSSPAYTDTGLNPTTNYRYTVTLRDSLGISGSPSPAAGATTPAAPPRAEVKIDGSKFFQSTSATITGTFDASGSDKLVVILTGEHGFNNNSGTVTSVTYDGAPLTPVIRRNAQVANTDTIYNHIWILDNPGASHVSGTIVANVVNRGNVTVFGLSGTLPGAGATAISTTGTRSADLATTAPNSLVIASFGMGGAGNTADVLNVTVDPPLTFVSAQENGSLWDGHVTGYAKVASAGPGTYSFSGGNANGANVIAAEFPAAPISVPLPTLAPADIVDDQGGGPISAGTPVTYTLTFSENMNPTSITADDFENAGSSPITIHSVTGIGKVYTVSLTPGSGNLQLRVKAGAGIADIYGNPLDTASPVTDDTTITVTAETTAPTLVSIDDDVSGGPITAFSSVIYNVTFDEPINASTVDVADFGNAGSASVSIESVTPTGDPAVYTVSVTANGGVGGNLILEIVQGATIEDLAGNPLDTNTALPDDTTITVNAETTAPTLVSIEDDVSGGPITAFGSVIYTVTFDEPVNASTVDVADFGNAGSASVSIESVTPTGDPAVYIVLVTANGSAGGNLILEIVQGATIEDLAGNPLDTTSPATDDTEITVSPDPIPAIVSIIDNQGGGPVFAGSSFAYTVIFDQPIHHASLDAGDFENGSGPAFTVNAIAATSDPAVFTVHITPGGSGTITLQIASEAIITNLNGTPVDTTAAIPDDTTLTVNAGSGPARGTITVDGSVSWSAGSSTLTGNLNASGSDKLVVIVTGEHGFPDDHSGNVIGVTYDGVSLTRIVDRSPIPGTPQDQTFNDIWYLDNPGAVHDAGAIVATLTGSTRGSVTAFTLSGTAPGAGQSAISPQASKSVVLSTTFADSIVIASHGLGGDGNTANVTEVSAVAPLEGRQATAQAGGTPSPWDGHVVAYAFVPSSGAAIYSFSGGNLVGSHTIAAEFLAAEAPEGTPYGEWAAANAPTGNPDDDFDGDGVSNAIEFVLGGDKNTNDQGKLPALNASGGNLTFSFKRDRISINATTILSIQTGTDLATWTNDHNVPDIPTAGPPVAVVDNGNGTDTVTLMVAQAPGTWKFARLKVVITP
jgi:hypothetical protein